MSWNIVASVLTRSESFRHSAMSMLQSPAAAAASSRLASLLSHSSHCSSSVLKTWCISWRIFRRTWRQVLKVKGKSVTEPTLKAGDQTRVAWQLSRPVPYQFRPRVKPTVKVSRRTPLFPHTPSEKDSPLLSEQQRLVRSWSANCWADSKCSASSSFASITRCCKVG